MLNPNRVCQPVAFVIVLMLYLAAYSPALKGSEPTRAVVASYPILFRNASMQGDVVVDCSVDEDGTVSDATVVGGNAHRALQDHAIEAALKWRFEPAEGRQRQFGITFEFRLEEECGCPEISCAAVAWVDLPDRVVAVGSKACTGYR